MPAGASRVIDTRPSHSSWRRSSTSIGYVSMSSAGTMLASITSASGRPSSSSGTASQPLVGSPS